MESLNPHKLLKEEFVSNLNGSSKLEIFASSAAVPAFVVLRMLAVLSSDRKKNKRWSSLVHDFVAVILPTLLLLTVLADYVYFVTIPVIVLMAILLPYGQLIQLPLSRPAPSKLSFLVHYRFVMMLVTCICILAVDFTVFPRRYAKTETYGTSLMDLGVGSFVVANAMVSRQARSISQVKPGSSFWSVSPLLVLGFLRLWATRGVDYQVHVGEYGVHWNFFFTLAAVSLITTVVRVPVAYSGLLGLVILAGYQCALLLGLNSYLLSADRGSGLLSMNKEGVYSIFGYWSLHLFSLQLGHRFFFNAGSLIKTASKEHKWLNAAGIWLLDGILWLLVIFLDRFVENVSRRSCNMAYVVFTLAQNLEVIGIFSLAESFFSAPNLALVESFDHNLLLSFLVANLLTGLVNLSTNTIFVAPLLSFLLLVTYMALLVTLVAAFKARNIRLKFW